MNLRTLNNFVKRIKTHIFAHMYFIYMADQTARLYAGQSHENTDYYTERSP